MALGAPAALGKRYAAIESRVKQPEPANGVSPSLAGARKSANPGRPSLPRRWVSPRVAAPYCDHRPRPDLLPAAKPVWFAETWLAVVSNTLAGRGGSMGGLLKESVFGINILSLAGFVMMGLGLTLRRMARAGLPLSLGLMSAGTVLVLLGLYADRLPDF
jgi:hypothetical protein